MPKFYYALFFMLQTAALFADEGMFLYDIPPVKQVKDRYGFDLTPDFLKHLQLSTVRFHRWGTASFVSADGLIITNHHVGSTCLSNLSTKEHDYLEDGFYAATLADEIPCPGIEVLNPVLSVDVTEKVKNDDAAVQKANIARIEKEYSDKTSLRCSVTKLYHGGKYYLYGYKVYNDIRLVWAPEASVGSFGGDPDNYEYPRYCVDSSLFRAYENGKPAKIENFLKVSKTPLKEGDLVFVSGFPGRTERSFTREHLEYQRDVYFPWRLQKLYRREVAYTAFSARSIENARRIADDLDSVRNYRKRALGQLQALQTPQLWKNVAVSNQTITDACNAAKKDDLYINYDLFEGGEAWNSQLFKIALTLVRYADEIEKKNEDRFAEYQDANLDALKRSLFAETPIYEDVEILKLTDSLTLFKEKTINGGLEAVLSSSSLETAAHLVKGSKLADVAERKKLFEGGKNAVTLSEDTMIQMARQADAVSRNYRKKYEDNVETPMTKAYAELARQQFEKHGTGIYPDATFTLRLSYGKVSGYQESDGTPVAPLTDIAGIFKRAEEHKHKEPFNLPKSWLDAKDSFDLNTPFDFVTTNDIVGGNSGSAMVNAAGQIVGLAFDGNIYSLSNNFIYTEQQSRCVGVTIDVILETLRKVNKADRILKELGQ